MNKNKKDYESPQLTVVEFRMERGFAASGEANLWNGWGIEQEVQMMLKDGQRSAVNDDGDLTAGHFTDGGSISSTGWTNTETGGWF
ncbi:MAG: hypothetical protein IJ745_07750 [Bacteroidales bacterium]|nr:hypothetical protein [Bacteroidales bacterium]